MATNAALDAVLSRAAHDLLTSIEESQAARRALETLCAALLAHLARIEHAANDPAPCSCLITARERIERADCPVHRGARHVRP